jgi:hypothetical protein
MAVNMEKSQKGNVDDFTPNSLRRKNDDGTSSVASEMGRDLREAIRDSIAPMPLPEPISNQPPGAYYRNTPGQDVRRASALQFSLVGANRSDDSGSLLGATPQDDSTMNVFAMTVDSTSNLGLAVAEAVLEEEKDDTIVQANPMDQEEIHKRQLQTKKQKQSYILMFVLLFLLLFIAAAIIVGTVVGTRQRQPEVVMATLAPTAYLSMEPSEAPSSAPSSELNLVFMELPKQTQDNIQNSSTPQYMAWDWLMTSNNITNLPEWRKKQLFALATFFFAFEGENWNPLIRERWMDDTKDECLWFSSGFGYFDDNGYYEEWSLEMDGIPQVNPCNDRGEFIWLDLADLQLSGLAPFVPPEVFLLSSLKSILLYQSDIELPMASALPSELFRLTDLSETGGISRLEGLSMEINGLSGQIPSEMGMLTNVVFLYLRDNSFTGLICTELGEMVSLVELDLAGNYFSGSIPSELGQLSQLQWLDFANLTMLTGSIPSELSLMTSLRYLDLRGNTGISGTIPDELCYLQDASCTFLDWWGAPYNYTLGFECMDTLCGCDCPCVD